MAYVPSSSFNTAFDLQVTRIKKVDLSKDTPTSSDDKSPDVTDPVMRRRLPAVPGMAHPVVETRPKSADGSRVRRSTEISNGDALLSLLEEEQGQDSFRRSDSSIRRRPRRQPNLENLVIDRERAASPNRFSSGTNSPVDPLLTRSRRSYSCVDGAEVSRVLGTEKRASLRSPRSPFIVPEVSTPSLPSETDESTATSDVESQRQREARREERRKRRQLKTEDVRLAFSGGASATETPLTRPDKISERRQHWAERRAVSHIDSRSVRRLLDEREAALSTPATSEIDQTIRDVEETGREIQRMRLDSTRSERQDGARLTRRWRSELNKGNVEEALRNSQDTTPVPPARRARLRDSEETPRDGATSLHARLDVPPETPTQKAMLHHSTGSWRSNSAGDDEPMSPTSPTSPTFQKSGYDMPVSVRMGLAPRRRPQSTYDNIPEDGPTTGQYVRNSTSDVIDASKASPRDSRRHGVVYDDTVDIDNSGRSPLQRSATLPHNWNKPNTAYRWRQLHRPMKLDTLKAADGGVIAAPLHREDEQLQQLDNNIEAFQSRTLHSDRELGRKTRFQQMALARRDMDDGWDVAKPVVETEHAAPLVVPATELAADNSCKSDDTDSVASARDEGFESEYVCNSQRTSMSSTLEGELPSIGANVDGDSSVNADVTNGDLMSTPTESRKRYGGSQADSDDPYFARSIDSLVNTKELTLTDTINVDEPADNYNDIDTDKTMTTSAPEEGDSTTDETWTTTEYTVVHKVSMPLEPEVLPPAPPHRTTSKAESAKLTTTSRSTLLRKQPNNGAAKTYRSSPAATVTTPKPSVMSKVTKRNGTTKVTPSPTKPSVAAEVTARLSCPRPKRPSVLSRHPSTSSLTSDGSSAGSAVTSKPTRHARPTRPSSAVVSSPSRSTVRSPVTPDMTSLRTSPAFVRGAAGRATMPASMLREQKRRAAEARMSKEEAPVPPRRSSSIRRSRQLNLGKSPPTHRPMSAASPVDTESATSSGDERAPSTGRPRRSQVGGVGVAGQDQSKESKMSRFFNRLATGRPRREKDTTTTPEKPMTSSPASEGLARKTGLRQRTSTVGAKDSTVTHDNRNNKTRTDKSSITTSLIDKSPYRKSALNRSSCADHNGNLNVKNTTFHSSKC